ncbi:B- and T-lymphocyte attenuator [Eublepharis macularius]|uniref:B- and T-lymphocyte attenuator n=1 Tax=Eublepharis macularius TaxID=481883 RepID=A0AA97J233_EUBMA|nr:B- and T-lymphocyte attenuator [Eublepharis macularius]XP_054829692.1 B- and T-lymphocyte attenuator [Eublepharis macularius]XP_054829693.1 B- and T-lymphocyte attenuator [Eublepharis macularius]
MYFRSFELLFLFVMLTLSKQQAYGSEANNCTAAINVERNTEYHIKPGCSAIIKCPVTYCQKKPEMRWFKKKNHTNLNLNDGQRHTFEWINETIFVLNFFSAQKNDSGLYYCESSSGNQTDKGHYINIIVQEYDTNTTDDHGASEKDKTWIIYLFSSLGVLIVITVSCLGPLYFIWRHPVKNKKISSIPQHEMNVFNSYSGVTYSNVNTIRAPVEGSMLHHGAATPGLFKYKHGSSICDDQASCWGAIRATSNPACHPAVTTNHHLPYEDQDLLVYAALNHGEHSQRHEPTVEIELTEYATIGQKN